MRIAVIGAGIFGSTTAIKLAEAGYDVHLYEQYGDILQAASGINQYRLHRGYHYPRSKPTAISSSSAEPLFKKEYAEAIIVGPEHYYGIAKEGSLVNGKEFLDFCDSCKLEYEISDTKLVNRDAVDLVIKAEEEIINPKKLREVVRERLRKPNIKIFLNSTFDESKISDYDIVVNASYANLNFILNKYPEAKRNYQFELCEKLVLKLPDSFKDKSIVILDGPFMCIDPFNDSGNHVMGNVVHAIHHTNTGLFPEIPKDYQLLLNNGVIEKPKITNFKKFIESAELFLPEITKAEHVGSMYTFRTVLPNVEKTDERPTLVYKVNNKIINVFSGKIGNSVQAAIEVLEQVEKMKNDQSLR